MSVTTYNLPDGTEPIGNGTTNTLQYNDIFNPDRLTKYGYKNIGYNAIGYPVTYGSMHFDWENGKLAKYYEEEDPDGIMGYEENGERFLYRNNLFGDITAIYKGATKVAEYVYDAWGNCTITYDPDGIGARNPFRYRGYYWDNDIQMYYLMTRYYDPKTGRFINADSIKYLEPKILNGLNLYSYCNNNPIMNVDPSGHFLLMILGLIGCFGVLAVGAVVVVVGAVIETSVKVVELVINGLSWIFEALASTDGVDAFTGASPIAAPNPGTYDKGAYGDDIKIDWE